MFVLLLSPSGPPSPPHRSDSTPLVDKVGLTGGHRARWVRGPRFQVCSPSLLRTCHRQAFGVAATDPTDRHLQTSQRVTHTSGSLCTPPPSTPRSPVAFNILIYCWLVIESHCFCRWGGKGGSSLLREKESGSRRGGHTGMRLNGLTIRAQSSARRAQVFSGLQLINPASWCVKKSLGDVNETMDGRSRSAPCVFPDRGTAVSNSVFVFVTIYSFIYF